MKQSDREALNERYSNFMYNLRLLRRQHGLTQKQMAEILHISVSSLRQIEHDHMPPLLSVEIIFYAQIYFNVTAFDLTERHLDE